MGQKIHPRGMRLKIIQGYDSNWFDAGGKTYAAHILEDYKIRKFLEKKLKSAMLSRVEIDRKGGKLIIRLVTGRSGVVIGRGGQNLDTLRKELSQITGKKDIQLDVLEVARIDADPQLISESIAQQLEKRVAFRRAMKQAIQRAMRSGLKGIKIMISGRLGGAEIARTEWTREGRVPLHTFRADVEYGFSEAKTVFGIIGVKVWAFKDEVLPGEMAIANVKQRGRADDVDSATGLPVGLRGGQGRREGRGGEARRDGGRTDGRRGKQRRGSAPVTVSKIEDSPAESPSES
jgi:small subunit ribosomal protein S3